MKHAFVLAAAVSLCVLPATVLAQNYGSSPAPMMGSESITVQLTPQKDAPKGFTAAPDLNESGTATLKQEGSDVVVTLKMKNPASAAQPAHIHAGTCATLNPKPTYPLKNVTDGTSTTTLSGVKLSELETGGFAINVHKSTTEGAVYVSCGDIPKK